MGQPGRRSDREGRLSLVALAALAALIALVVLPAGQGDAKNKGKKGHKDRATCFWEGPISMKEPSTRGFDGHDFNFPEESATYWLARFRLPDRARLFLRGRFARARYQSLNAYSAGEPTDALADVDTRPLRRATNPFITGNRRYRKRRGYVVEVADSRSPGSGRSPNVLYAKPSGDASTELLYRVYEPDRGRWLAGGGGLPKPRMSLPNGSYLRDETQVCGIVNTSDRTIPVITTPAAQWFVATHAPGCDPATAPAVNPPRWERFFSLDYARQGFALGCTDAAEQLHQQLPHEDRGGFYSNGDIRYLYSTINRRHGPVLVIRAKMPTFPATFNRARRMRGGQVRFWSLCSTESPITTRTEDCLADRQVPLRPDRGFTIVVSRAGDRPANANEQCGVAWLAWPARGDVAENPDYGNLVLRNMLPAPDFAQAIQRVRRHGTEAQVMGEYFPRGAYTTRAGFEALGCPAV